MKRLFFLLVLFATVGAFAQTYSLESGESYPVDIDRAMPLWSRAIVNSNFDEIYAEVDTLQDANNTYFLQSFNDSSVTVALTEDTWAVATNATTTLWTASSNNITAAGDSATIVDAGDYYVSFSLSFKATADDTIQVAVFKNAARATAPAEVQLIGTETETVASSSLLLNLVAGDDISLRMQNTASGDDASLKDGSLVLYMLKPD